MKISTFTQEQIDKTTAFTIVEGTNNVIIKSTNEESKQPYKVQLKSAATVTMADGSSKLKPVSALYSCYDLEEAKFFVEYGQEFLMNNKIVVLEHNQPFYEGQQPVINPTTNQVVMRNNESFYRTTKIFPNSTSNSDALAQVLAQLPATEIVKKFNLPVE